MLGFDALGRLALGEFAVGGSSTVILTADAGSYSIIGNAVTFKDYIVGAPGAYAITGNATAFSGNFIASSGSYAITGGATTLRATLLASSGSYSLSGNAAGFKSALPAQTGSYSLSGNPAGLQNALLAESGQYNIAGGAALLPANIVAGGGSYLLTLGQYELHRTGFDYPPDYYGIGHYKLEIERIKQLAAITRQIPPPIVRQARVDLRPITAPQQQQPVAQLIDFQAILAARLDAKRSEAERGQQAAIAKRRRQESEVLLLAAY